MFDVVHRTSNSTNLWPPFGVTPWGRVLFRRGFVKNLAHRTTTHCNFLSAHGEKFLRHKRTVLASNDYIII